MEIRLASKKDAAAIRRIYEPYVKETAVSFEYEVPSVSELEERIGNTLVSYPYLVAVVEGEIAGYVYAGSFHTREAYKHGAELSIYVDRHQRQKGIGSALYREIQEILLAQNVITVHACIASPDGEDPYVTSDSEKFHARMGFQLAGRHDRCGYKFGRWFSIVWMDKVIGERTAEPEPFIPFSSINKDR